MKGTEIDQFEKKYGYKPTPLRTSVDALAVFVNKDNPIKCLTIDAGRRRVLEGPPRRLQGGHQDVGQLVDREWASRPISLYGRNSASGTYGFFKEHALKNGDYKDEVKEQPGSASVVQGSPWTASRRATAGSATRRRASGPVPLAAKDGDKCHEATPDEAYSGNYPLSRFLYVYINKAPGKALDPVTREFVRLIMSKEGQEVVVKDGYFRSPADREGRAEQDPVDGRKRRPSRRAQGGRAGIPVRPLVVSSADQSPDPPGSWASRLVVVGGLIIIAAILAILFVIVAEVYPLFKVPTATWSGPTPPRIRHRRAAGWQRGPRGRRVSRDRVRHRPAWRAADAELEGRSPCRRFPSPVWMALKSRPSGTGGTRATSSVRRMGV